MARSFLVSVLLAATILLAVLIFVRSAPPLRTEPMATPAASDQPTVEPVSRIQALDHALRSDAASGFLQLLRASLAEWGEVSSYQTIMHKKERRDGKVQPVEVVQVRFHKPYCVRMDWLDESNEDKRVLFVRGKYGDKLNIQIKVFVRLRMQKEPTDPMVMAKTRHPITDASFGKKLENTLALTREALGEGDVTIEYHGLIPDGPDGQPAFKVTRAFHGAVTALTRVVDWIDAATLMPLQFEAHDEEGFRESYAYLSTTLDPLDEGGQPLLTAERYFHRAQVFPDYGTWAREPERWNFSDLGPTPR